MISSERFWSLLDHSVLRCGKNKNILGMPEGSNGYDNWNILIISDHLKTKKSAEKLEPMEFSGLSKFDSTEYLFNFYRILANFVSVRKRSEKRVE